MQLDMQLCATEERKLPSVLRQAVSKGLVIVKHETPHSAMKEREFSA